jgi:outer membrane immunogenic protein
MKFKNVLMASAAGFAVAPVAEAADLPRLKAAPMPMAVPVANWAGWYAGVNVGVANVGMTRRDEDGEPRDYSSNTSGFIGGGQLGYNWQRGYFVYGVEADISGLAAEKTWPGGRGASNNLPWLSTVRGRMGLALADTLVYATAGLAIGEVKTTKLLDNGEIQYSQSKTQLGWAVGGGVEHMLSRNWTVALEGLYVNLGSTPAYCTRKCDSRTVDTKAAIARFKLNYKF